MNSTASNHLVIRHGRPGEYHKLITMTSKAFGLPRSTFARDYANAYPPQPVTARRFFVAERAGEIAGFMNVTPMIFRIGGCSVPGNGVGGIATMPQHRGHGVMRTLLQSLHTSMPKDGQVLSILWGHRARYSRYGWEVCGIEPWFGIRRKLLVGHEAPRGAVIRRATPPDRAAIHRLYGKNRWGIHRRPNYIALLLHRRQFPVFLCQHNRRAAYIVTHRQQPTRILEVGGHLPLIASLLAWQLDRSGQDRADVTVPIEDERLRHFLWPLSQTWANQAIGHVQIGCLESFIRAVGPALRLRMLKAKIKNLKMSIPDTGQAVAVSIRNSRLHIGSDLSGRYRHVIRADQCSMTRLLLGAPDGVVEPTTNSDLAGLGNLFPLPWWFSAWDQV